MATNTKIQWTDHTLNFWMGCTKVSPGCKACYMYRDQKRYNQNPMLVRSVSDNTIKSVIRKAKPGDKIFVCSWSDFFIEEADQFREAAWDTIRQHPEFIWQILTKRPERIEKCLPADWGDGWTNVWLGVSVENKDYLYRIVELLLVPAQIRFVSVEPLLAPVDLTRIAWPRFGRPMHFVNALSGITESRVMDDSGNRIDVMRTEDFGKVDWVIIGGESGNNIGEFQYRECNTGWLSVIADACIENSIPVFIKQLGTFLAKRGNLKDRHGGDIEEFPETLKIRQFPT